MPELNWVGKKQVIAHHHDVPYRVLDYRYSYSDGEGNAAETQEDNKIIHGDNLEALKSLLPKYEGRVDVIYIDPPYNTGSENWVYNDNVNDPQIQRWLGEVVGKEGDDLSRHDKWLCMMYPRLRLLEKLLAPTGAIFISIDDNEINSLKFICDEIFGSACYKGTAVRTTGTSTGQDAGGLASSFDSVMIYSKRPEFCLRKVPLTEEDLKRFKNKDENGPYSYLQLRKTGSNDRREDRPNMYYPVTAPDGSSVYPVGPGGYDSRWRYEKSTYEDRKARDMILWKTRRGTGELVPYVKYYPDEGKRPSSIWKDLPGNKKASLVLKNIFGKKVFDYPKPVELVEEIIKLVSDRSDLLVLDSFAGSGTTGHAVLNLNKKDGGDRRFILVELMDYAEPLTAERIRRVISGYGAGKKAQEGTGGSFSFYELGEPMFVDGGLNADIPIQKIREYIWYSETQQAMAEEPSVQHPYYLGTANHTAYHLIYEPNEVTVLDLDYAAGLTAEVVSDSQVVYADVCALSESELAALNITFKKIPRDIAVL